MLHEYMNDFVATLLAAVLGGAITAYFAVHQLRVSKRQAADTRTQMYLTLEMASVELFRFEANYKEAVARFEGVEALDLDKISDEESVLLTSYITQFLNLFELAAAFRKNDMFPANVFATWVAWMYDSCSSATFQVNWPGFRAHYSGELAEILDKGTDVLSKSPELDERQRKRVFYHHVASLYDNCRFIRSWADR